MHINLSHLEPECNYTLIRDTIMSVDKLLIFKDRFVVVFLKNIECTYQEGFIELK